MPSVDAAAFLTYSLQEQGPLPQGEQVKSRQCVDMASSCKGNEAACGKHFATLDHQYAVCSEPPMTNALSQKRGSKASGAHAQSDKREGKVRSGLELYPHGEEGDGGSLLAGTPCPPNAMRVLLDSVRHVIVHDQ